MRLYPYDSDSEEEKEQKQLEKKMKALAGRVAALEQKSASCRLLLSLFVLDAINWVCYKLFQARAAARAAPPAPRAAAHAALPPPSHRAAARRSF